LSERGGAGGSPSDALYREDEVNDVHLSMSPSDWESIIQDTMGNVYRHATLRWKEVTVEDVGVRPRGHSTRYPGNLKMSLKIQVNAFVPGQRFLGLKEIKLDGLRERTLMRERLAYGAFREILPAAPRAAHCKLYVNGEYRGVYMLEEPPNGDLVKHRFRGEPVGNLYHIFVARPEAYTFEGPDPSLYVEWPWEPETNKLDGDHTVIPRFLEVLNHRPAELAGACDVENLAAYLALEAAVISYDGILRDAGPPQNHFALFRFATGRFEFIPWDLDQCLTDVQAERGLWHNFDNSYLTRAVRDTPEFRALYLRKVADVIESAAHPDRLRARIEAIYHQIREFVYADPYKIITNAEFDANAAYLKGVVQRRYENLRAQLAAP
jgi:spore coat protein CotH